MGGFHPRAVSCKVGVEGASRAKEGGAAAASSETKVVPLKLQVFNLLVEQLAEQGLDQEVLGGLRGFRPEDVVESVQVREPPEDVSKVWVFVLLFRPSWGGLSVGLAVAPFAGSSSNGGQEGWNVSPSGVAAWTLHPG